MEKKMETTVVYGCFIGIIEKKMETTVVEQPTQKGTAVRGTSSFMHTSSIFLSRTCRHTLTHNIGRRRTHSLGFRV